MITVKSQFVQQTLTAMTLFLILVALSMIRPVIFALFLGVLSTLRSCSAEAKIAMLFEG